VTPLEEIQDSLARFMLLSRAAICGPPVTVSDDLDRFGVPLVVTAVDQ